MKISRQSVLFALPILFFVLFYFYPLASILGLGLSGKDGLAAVQGVFRDGYIGRILFFTFWQAALSTLLTLLPAIAGAYVFATYRFRGKQLIRTISTLPFVLPTVVVANAFTALLGPRGLLNEWLVNSFGLEAPPIDLDRTIWLILLAHVFYNYSVALRIISSYWENLDPGIKQAAAMLGASPRRIFWTVTLPLLRPAIAAATALVFVFTFTSFGVILILGGPGFATLEVEIYRQAVNLFNLPVAAILSLLQIVITFGLMVAYTSTQRKIGRTNRKTRQYRPIKTLRDRLIVYSNLTFMLLLLATPLTALVTRSFLGANGFTLRFYRQLFINERGSVFFVPPIQATRNSILIALATTAIALTLGLIIARMIDNPSAFRLLPSTFLDPLFMLPLATSAVTLGFGYIIALDEPPLNLRESLALIPIAHSLIAIPFVIRSILPALRAINPSLREAAGVMGAAPDTVWRTVDLPLIRRALVVATVFAFTVSMGEFGATVFIARPNLPTMPVAIFRFLGQPGALNYGQALAMSSVLMLVCAVGFIAIERFRADDAGEF